MEQNLTKRSMQCVSLFRDHVATFIDRSCVAVSISALPMNQAYVRDCETHLRRAAELDPEHPVPSEILLKVRMKSPDVTRNQSEEKYQFSNPTTESQEIDIDSDDAADVNENNVPARPSKRQR
jgi:hypothetical protein